jgi:hypothetical protein
VRGEPQRLLLGGFATDTLTEAERSELLRAALDDQELFDALLEEEGLRQLLEPPGARHEVLAALDRPAPGERLRAWLVRPARIADLAALAAILVLGLLLHRVFWAPRSPVAVGPTASRPAARAVSPPVLVQLVALPARQLVPATLELEGRPPGALRRVRPGEALLVRMSLTAPARVLLIAAPPQGSPAQLFPPAGGPPALIPPPPRGGPAVHTVSVAAPEAPGLHRLRLVVAPADLDLGGATANIQRAAARLTLVDLTYEVGTP